MIALKHEHFQYHNRHCHLVWIHYLEILWTEIDLQKVFFCIGFKRPFQYISGHIRMVPACNRECDNHFIVLSHWNITPQAQSMISRTVTLFWQRVNQFLRWTTLSMSSIWQGSFNYQLEIFGLTLPGIEPGTSQIQSKCAGHMNTIMLNVYC